MGNLQSFFTWDKITSICIFIAKPLLILLVCKLIINLLLKVSNNLLNKSKLDKGISGFISSAVKIALWCITIIIVADSVGIDTTSLVAIVGVVSLALSLSVQDILTNVFSGITLLISRPFAVGDYIDVSGLSGTVRSISLMRTVLVTPDNKVESIPNGTVCSSNITNYSTEPLRRVEIKVSASYDAPTSLVQEAIFEVLVEDNRIKRDEDKMPTVRLSAYNANDIEYTVRMWVDNKEYWNVYFDVLENIRESFAKHKIEFSYPHTVVHMKKD